MGKSIILVHGRHFKPPASDLKEFWVEALRFGIERDHPGKLSALANATIELVYYGDVSNEFLKRNSRDEYDADEDVIDRRKCLDLLKDFKKSQFNERTYRKQPGASRWREGLADIFAGPLAVLGLSDRAISLVAPDMAEYWDDATDFGSRVRAPMVRPLIDAFDRKDKICVIGHSLGSLISFDTFWKFSHMSEYRGSIRDDLDFGGKLIDLFISIGSPLGDATAMAKMKGSDNRDLRRFPTNVNKWVNLAAEDDFICHDEKIANDYDAMVTIYRDAGGRQRRRSTKIRDIRMYNLSVRGVLDGEGTSNPHHGTGYLISPEMAKTIAGWL